MKNVLQNKMKKTGVRSIALLLIIGFAVLICLTGAATAATEINTTVQSGTYTIATNGEYTVTNVIAGTGRIVVNENVEATIYLNDVNLTNSLSPLQLKNGSKVTLILVDGTINTFTSSGTSTAASAVQSGIHVSSGSSHATSGTPYTTTLIIKGETSNTGKLTAIGGSFSAGIGGGPNQPCGEIIIESGIVEAIARVHHTGIHQGTSANAAGIGSGGGNTSLIYPALSPYQSSVTIRGNADVKATSEGHGAGIGEGGSTHSAAGGGTIVNIYGDANVTAISKANGAGIGGGGSDNSTAGAGGMINIYGNANVTATSEGFGAGVGGGGINRNNPSSNNMAGAGGIVNIYENANVTASSKKNGAGIGGGGSDAGMAGTGGTINIYGNATVDAFNNIGNGAGIGGGGTNSGTAGAGGNVNIYNSPIIVAEAANADDIGPGNSGASGTIVIIGGNVYAEKTIVATNSNMHGNDALSRSEITLEDQNGDPLKNEKLVYTVIGSNMSYEYTAMTDENGKAYLWIPLGNQLVIGLEDGTGRKLGSETVILTPNQLETVFFLTIPNYSPLTTEVEKQITWNGTDPLEPIIYMYERSLGTLELMPYDSVTLVPISITNPYIVTPMEDEYYNYSGDITALTASVDSEYPGRYALTPQGSTIVFVHSNNANTVNVYYTPQPGSSTGSGNGGSGHGSATIVPGENNTGSSNKSDSNTTPTRLTILCVDEKGSKLFIQSLTTVVGSSEAINAPPLEGYKLLTGEKSKNIKMEAGDNTITFKYAELLTGQQSDDENGKWSLSWLIFVLIFIAGITVSFLIGRKSRK